MGILTYRLPRNLKTITDIVNHVPKNWGGIESFFVSPKEPHQEVRFKKFLDLTDIAVVRPISDLVYPEADIHVESLNGQRDFEAVRIDREFDDRIKETRLFKNYIKACLRKGYVGYFYFYEDFRPKNLWSAQKIFKFSNATNDIYGKRVDLKCKSGYHFLNLDKKQVDELNLRKNPEFLLIKDMWDLKEHLKKLKLKRLSYESYKTC